VGEIRGQAIAALIRAAERAGRTGAPGLAATSYATAAGLTAPDTLDSQLDAGLLWESAAQASVTSGDYAEAVEHAVRAHDYHLQHDQARAAARARAIAGQALRRWGRHAQAREQFTTALAVLREEPDADTVQALGELARLEADADAPAAEALSTEALALGQDLAVDDATLAGLFTTRGICHAYAGRKPGAASCYREAARLAAQAGDNLPLAQALQALIAVAEAFTAAAGRQPTAALRCARAILGHAGTLGISHEYLRWAWPLAVRAAWDLADTNAAAKLLALLDRYRPGQLAPMQRAERDLARARLAASSEDPATTAAFATAIHSLRERCTPYHLAHGLLDDAQHLDQLGDHEAAETAITEARDIAERLRCQPLLDRAGPTRETPGTTPKTALT
jgi:tetratricopeptide (TPR) repeat protein